MAGLETIILYIISLPVRVNGRIGDHYIVHYFSTCTCEWQDCRPSYCTLFLYLYVFMAGLETIILYIISLPVRVNGRIGDHYIVHYFSTCTC